MNYDYALCSSCVLGATALAGSNRESYFMYFHRDWL